MDRPCVEWTRFARAHRLAPAQDRAWFLRYVFKDEDVGPEFRSVPAAARPSEFSALDLHSIARAALVATRSSAADLWRKTRARRVFLFLARALGWRRPKLLARFVGVTRIAIHKRFARPCRSGELQAALLYAASPRFYQAIALPPPRKFSGS